VVTVRVAAISNKPLTICHLDLSVLESAVPAFLTRPIPAAPVFACIGAAANSVFTFMFILSSFRARLFQGDQGLFYKHGVRRLQIGLGWLALTVLGGTYLSLFVSFDRAVKDTRIHIVSLGRDAPRFTAEIANGFISEFKSRKATVTALAEIFL
jgi:hypothetical protein